MAKSLFRSVDAYTLSAARFAVACAGFVLVLRFVEGRRAFGYEGRLRRAAVAGFLGYVVGVMFVYAGLEHTTATSASVIMATQPFIAAIALRIGAGARLSRATRWSMIAAFAGATLVVTRGDPASLIDGSIGWGILLVLLGQVGWVLYTIDSVSFTGWSSLRYTTLTALPGGAVLITAAFLLIVTGVTTPTVSGLVAQPVALTYSIIGPAFLAVLAWNAGRARLGAQSIALFPNLVPVMTFGIEIARGYDVRPLEVVGAVITIAALTTSTLLDGRAAGAVSVTGVRVPAPEPL